MGQSGKAQVLKQKRRVMPRSPSLHRVLLQVRDFRMLSALETSPSFLCHSHLALIFYHDTCYVLQTIIKRRLKGKCH